MISAVIITHNEASNIERCIRSVQEVVQEVLVLDSGSTDATVALATALGARVEVVDWKGYAATKNLGNQLASHPIILSIDADEALSDNLRKSLLMVHPIKGVAYSMNRLTSYAGKWIRHSGWYPDTKVRLFHRDEARWVGDFVHETVALDPGVSIQHLQGDLLHFTIDSVADHRQRIQRYMRLSAAEKYQQGRHISVWKAIGGVVARWLKIYLLKQGFRDGREGWYIATLSAQGVWLRYKYLREMYR